MRKVLLYGSIFFVMFAILNVMYVISSSAELNVTNFLLSLGIGFILRGLSEIIKHLEKITAVSK